MRTNGGIVIANRLPADHLVARAWQPAMSYPAPTVIANGIGDGTRRGRRDRAEPARKGGGMDEHNAGDRMAELLLPYCRHDLEDADGPNHESGWWFANTPPKIAREALSLAVDWRPGDRANDQPPEEWLVEQAEQRGGALAGFAAPKGPCSPRMRVDAIIVSCSQAEDLAREIARLWPVEDYTALDLAVLEGLASADADRRLWGLPGSEFLSWRADRDDWLGATHCSFWWD